MSEGKKLPTNHYRATISLLNKKSIPAPPKYIHKISEHINQLLEQYYIKTDLFFMAHIFKG